MQRNSKIKAKNLLCDLRDIYNEIRLFEAEFCRRRRLSLNEAMLLCTLDSEQPLICKDLSERLALTPSNLSKVIKSIEDKHFIVRELSKYDKRQMCFSLSHKGRAKLLEIHQEKAEITEVLEKIRNI
jgi:DNA-binding MarR family transcriptional regulator